MINRLSLYILTLVIFIFGAGFSCDGDDLGNTVAKYVQEVRYKPTGDNDLTMTVEVVCTDKVKIKTTKEYPIKSNDVEYGKAFLSGYSADENKLFTAGLTVNKTIFEDERVKQFIGVEATNTLPNGSPIGVPNMIAKFQSPTPVGGTFDIYGYVDPKAAWLGVAGMFFTSEDSSFLSTTTITQTLAKDTNGKPSFVVYLFGADVTNNGAIQSATSVAVFANVQALGSSRWIIPGQTMAFKPVEPAVIQGGPHSFSEKLEFADKVENKILPALERL